MQSYLRTEMSLLLSAAEVEVEAALVRVGGARGGGSSSSSTPPARSSVSSSMSGMSGMSGYRRYRCQRREGSMVDPEGAMLTPATRAARSSSWPSVS